jgi:hypothetical protein
MKTFAQIRRFLGRGDNRVGLDRDVALRLDRYVAPVPRPEPRGQETIALALDWAERYCSQRSRSELRPVPVPVTVDVRVRGRSA